MVRRAVVAAFFHSLLVGARRLDLKESLRVDQVECSAGEYYFRLGGDLLSFAVSQTAAGADTTVACPDSARNPSGTAVFRCHSSGQWMMLSETCSHGQGECAEGTFRLAFGGHPGTFNLAPTAAGSDLSMPCAFGPFNAGEITFRCSAEGSWGMGPNTCQLGDAGNTQGPVCRAGNFPLTFDGERATYSVPAGNAQESVEIDCAFETINQGTMTFSCQDNGQWTLSGNSCRRVGECGQTEYTLMMNNHNSSFMLHRAPDGVTVARDCAFGDATVGQVLFRCSGGEWSNVPGAVCLKPGQCAEQVVQHQLGWTHVDVGDAGAVVTKDCDFGAFTEGQLNFLCQDGKWELSSQDCHEPPLPDGVICRAREASFERIVLGMWTTAEEQHMEVTFQLPQAPEGITKVPCMVQGFVGEVSFMCNEDGGWTLLRTPGSNTCKQANFHEWEEYYLRGKAEGWIP